jgi:hypothetical protein
MIFMMIFKRIRFHEIETIFCFSEKFPINNNGKENISINGFHANILIWMESPKF